MKRSVVLAMLLAVGASAQTSRPARAWLDSVDAGYIEAQKAQRPVLVLISDDRYASPFDKTLADPKVAAKLADWVLVRLGPQDRDARQAMGVAIAPTLRVLTPAGRVVARLDAVLSPDAMAAFLDKAAEVAAPPVMADTDVPSLVKALGSPDAAVREAATRQLLSRQKDAAPAVVDALAGDNATARIAAADLLEEWAAPLDGVDPWQRSTVTPDRLAALKAWAAKPIAPTTAPATQPYDATVVSEELNRLLAAATAADARAVRERLVRFGDNILPQVTQRLAAARSADARTRLTALRYRLAATDSFAVAWPGGFDRLAAVDSFTRRAALDELAKLVKPTDSRLLLELFGDDDPVVREKALSLLRSVGGDSKALVKLLADPEPNVRAAVLKSLAADGENRSDAFMSFDTPAGAAAPANPLAGVLAKYVATETDPDLLVHAIHVLKNMPDATAAESLKDLLSNPEWRVRAEAADALREKLGGYRNGLSDTTKAKLYAALIKCLDDPEGFVVAKAVAALAKANLPTATEAMIKTISRRPEMAQEILKVIASDESMSRLANPQLKELLKDPKPEIRAAAIKAIVVGTPVSPAELKLALADPDERVRLAGVNGVLAAMNSSWPNGGYVERWTLLSGKTRQKVDVVQWIDDYRSGKTRPAWVGELGPTLEKMAQTEKPNIALPAAVALCGLAKEEPHLPQIHAAIDDAGARWVAVAAMNWLPWEKRQPLFRELMAATPPDEQASVFRTFARVPDPRGAEEVWAFAAKLQLPAGDSLMDPIHDALQSMYFGEEYYNMSRVPEDAKKTAREALEKYAATGSDPQRIIAMTLMLLLDDQLAEKTATTLLADPKISDALKPAVLQMRLIAQHDDTAVTPLAVEALGSPLTRNIAVRYLAGGAEALHEMHGIYLSVSSSSYYSGDEPIVVKAPAGLKVDPVLQAMKDSNQETAAYAGYLAALLGHPEGLKPLEAHWRKEGAGDQEWSRLVYRAITKLNDDSKTPTLEEIYNAYGKTDYRLREFYWTIRAMKGDNILKLRKKIRDEVGMDRLK